MIPLPDFTKPFEHENDFYLTSDPQRIAKLVAHYELFKMSDGIPGDIIECGVFKGSSFIRFATFREMMEKSRQKRMIGFDTFGTFPNTVGAADQHVRDEWVKAAGDQSISIEQLRDVLSMKKLSHQIELVEGDVTVTIPKFVARNPQLKISLLNLDTDFYEPAAVILHYLYPLLERSGVLILDDYGVFSCEIRAVDEYFSGQGADIRSFDFISTPKFVIKT